MPAKRARPPSLSDGTELNPNEKSSRTPAKRQATVSKNFRSGASSTTSKSAAKATPKVKPPPKEIPNRIKVGVDFGTTNSGVAHVMWSNSTTVNQQNVDVIKDWAGGIHNNEHLEKVPSRIAFSIENQEMSEDKWGYEVPLGARSYTWFKLLLDASAEETLPDNDELTTKMETGILELPNGMTAEEVAAAYLSKLYSHTMGALEKRYTASILKVTSIDFWFTVPATWQEYAVDATRMAAKKAGFGSRKGDRLSIITEPEAAAVAVLSSAMEKNPELLKIQKNVLIADLGGGTLDFQVLTIKKLKPRLETEETIPGIGGKAGSAYIDSEFYAWAKSTFGDAFDHLPKQKTGSGSKFMSEWEAIKKTFSGKDLSKEHQIAFPALGTALRDRNVDSPSYDFGDHSVLITGEQIARMFEPVIQKAFKLVDELCDTLKSKEIAGFRIMCLCGGLGSSEYVWRCFQQYTVDKLNGKCEVFADGRAWSAVVRGAAIRGLSGSLVLSKTAKRAFGIGIHQKFQDGKDKEEDAEECPIKGKRARGYVHWPIKVGRRFEANMRVKTELYVTIPENAEDEDMIFEWQLFSSALEKAPPREDDPGVKEEAWMTLDLSATHKQTRREDGSHDNHEAVKVDIVIKMGNECGTLMVEALHGKKVLGTAKIDYARKRVRQLVSQSAGQLEE